MCKEGLPVDPSPECFSQPSCLLLPSNLLPWETSVLSVTSHIAPWASSIPCQADPNATPTPPNYWGQNAFVFKCSTHLCEIFRWIIILPFPLLTGARRGMDLAWLTPLWVPGLIPLLPPPSPGCHVPNPSEDQTDGPLSWWDKRHLQNTNHHPALGSPTALEMEVEETDRIQLLRLRLLMSMDGIHVKGGKQACFWSLAWHFLSFLAEINCNIWQPLKCITCLCDDLLIEFLWIITTTNIYWALTTCQATNTCLCHLILISTLWNRFLD